MAIRLLRSSTLSISACVRTTPLGKPVVPEVYMMKAVAAGSTARARAARSSAETLAAGPASAPQSTVPAWGEPPSRITRRSIGKRGSRTSSPVAGSVTASRTRAA